MTGPEAYREAADCLDRARRASDKGRDEDAAFWQREAQVHATLALAAATALRLDDASSMPGPDWDAWCRAASEGPGQKRRQREAGAAEAAEFAQEVTS